MVDICDLRDEKHHREMSGRGEQMRLERRADELQEGDATPAVRNTGNLTPVRLPHSRNDLGREDSNTDAHCSEKERMSENYLRASRQQWPAASEQASLALQIDDANEAASLQIKGLRQYGSLVDRSSTL